MIFTMIWVLSTILILATFGVSLLGPKPTFKRPYGLVLATFAYGLFLFLGVSTLEIIWIILPQLMGFITLAKTAKWKYLASFEPDEEVGLIETHPAVGKIG